MVCLKSTFDSTTNHLNISPMFLNCLLLDLTVIDLTSIVHMDKFWVEIAKYFEMRTSGGRGGFYSDFGHPRTRGEGGQKRANFWGRPLWMAPKSFSKGFGLLLGTCTSDPQNFFGNVPEK